MYCFAEHISTQDLVNISRHADIRISKLNVERCFHQSLKGTEVNGMSVITLGRTTASTAMTLPRRVVGDTSKHTFVWSWRQDNTANYCIGQFWQSKWGSCARCSVMNNVDDAECNSALAVIAEGCLPSLQAMHRLSTLTVYYGNCGKQFFHLRVFNTWGSTLKWHFRIPEPLHQGSPAKSRNVELPWSLMFAIVSWT